MRHFLFHRESNDFTDILSDGNIKKNIKTKIKFYEHLIIGIPKDKNTDKVISYIMIMFGESLIDFKHIIPDRTPVIYKDYMPKNNNKY